MVSKKLVFVTGSSGQLGLSIKKIVKKKRSRDLLFNFFTKKDLNITNKDSFEILKQNPSYLINCAAYTNVNEAETDKDNCFKINYYGVKNLVEYCNTVNCKLIQISTDYVFDGTSKDGYYEDAETSPLNTYGISKKMAEEYILKNSNNFQIIRTSWVYSEFGRNFVKTVIENLLNKKNLKLICDQYGCPTYAPELANYIILNHINGITHLNNGISHFSSMEVKNWYEFGINIYEAMIDEKKLHLNSNIEIKKIMTNEYSDSVIRPSNSVLRVRDQKEKLKLIHDKNSKILREIIRNDY